MCGILLLPYGEYVNVYIGKDRPFMFAHFSYDEIDAFSATEFIDVAYLILKAAELYLHLAG